MILNIFWLIIDSIIRLGGTFVFNVLLARYLGPDQYGVFSYALAIVGAVSMFGLLGFNSVVVRDLARDKTKAQEILGTILVLRFIGALMVILVSVLSIYIIKPNDFVLTYLVLVVSIGVLFQIFDVIDLYFESQVQSKYVIWFRQIVFLTMFVIKLWLMSKSASLLMLAWASSGEILLMSIGSLLIYSARGFKLKEWVFKTSVAKEFIKQNWPLACSNALLLLYVSINQLMLDHFLGSKAVGVYAAAVRLSEAWYFIPAAFLTTFFPILINIKKTNRQQYDLKFQELYNVLTLMSIGVALLVTVFAKPLIQFVYGNQFVDAYLVLTVHIWAAVFVGLGWVSNYWLVEENLQHVYLYRTILGCISCIGLNLVFIPLWHEMGAALSMVLSRAVISCSTGFFRGAREKTRVYLRSFHLVNNFRSLIKLILEHIVLVNIFSNRDKSAKRALLIYKVVPLIVEKWRSHYNHQNEKQVRQIAKALHDKGYIVDVVDINNDLFVPAIAYDLVITHRLNHPYDESKVWANAVKVYLSSTMEKGFYNQQLSHRYQYLRERKGVLLKILRQEDESMAFLQCADAIVGFGNELSIGTWKKVFHGPVYSFNNYGFNGTRFIEDRNIDEAKKNFLYFSSWPQVLKGLDLLLEVFAKHPDLHLYVCSPFRTEPDFCELYKHELFCRPNIHPVGVIPVNSHTFEQLTRRCGYVVLPSASEGMAGSVLQCMSAGLLPIISKESGIDLDNSGLFFPSDRIIDIETVILKAASQSNEEVKVQVVRLKNIIQSRYTEEVFMSRWYEIITNLSTIKINA